MATLIDKRKQKAFWLVTEGTHAPKPSWSLWAWLRDRWLWMKWFSLVLVFLLAGCEADVRTMPNPEQHTGPVTVVDVSVGYCLPAVGEKSGTAVCDRTLTLKNDLGLVYQLGLERSGAWPPVWKGMRADIHFKQCEHCYPPASTIIWVQELKQ